MHLDGRPRGAARALGVIALMGAASAVAIGVTRPLPDPYLMASVDNACLQFSQDGGQVWGDVNAITLDSTFAPVPGGTYLQGNFLARNRCNSPAALQVYAGAWEVTGAGSGLWKADLGETAGSPVPLNGPSTQDDWGVLISEVAAPTNVEIPVKLYIGIPAAETTQSFSIDPAWSFALAPIDAPAVPEAPSILKVQPASPTTRDRVTVTGTAEPGATVTVTVGGQARCTATADADGAFSCDVGTLTRGSHQISATAANDAGVSAAAPAVEVLVRNAGLTGWGSLDDLLNWGSLGGLGSLGSVGSSGSASSGSSGSSGSSDSAEGVLPAASLGSLGSAVAGSGSGTGGDDVANGTGAAQGAGTNGAGTGVPGASAAGPGASGAGQSGGASPVPGTGTGAGAPPGPATGPATGQPPATSGRVTAESGGGSPGASAPRGNADQTGGVAPGAAAGGPVAGGLPAGGTATGGQPTSGQGASGAGTGQLAAETLGFGSSGSGQSAANPLGSVDGLIQLGSSTLRVGS